MPSMAATIDGRAARTAAGTVASLSFMTAATSAVDISSIRAKRAAADSVPRWSSGGCRLARH